jgi:hypothetical protein
MIGKAVAVVLAVMVLGFAVAATLSSIGGSSPKVHVRTVPR